MRYMHMLPRRTIQAVERLCPQAMHVPRRSLQATCMPAMQCVCAHAINYVSKLWYAQLLGNITLHDVAALGMLAAGLLV